MSTDRQLSTSTAELTDFEIILERKKKRPPWWERDEARIACAKNVKLLLERMKKAACDDEIHRRQGRLVMQKLLLVREVKKTLQKTFLQGALLEQGVLQVIAQWLNPTAEGTLCTLTIRETLLKALLQLTCIKKSHLEESRLINVMRKLREHPDETRDNKKRARELVDRWNRVRYGIAMQPLQLSRREWSSYKEKRGLKTPSTYR
uniref:TFIIS N-terminal domain-containing protein n=1 Tax=Anopheles farauti TaxID=69004 RepID=A0A182Q463_9DIPT